METKNLLFITADQWRGECLSALKHPTVKTPNLDALAADGIVFHNHFAQCTVHTVRSEPGVTLHRDVPTKPQIGHKRDSLGTSMHICFSS